MKRLLAVWLVFVLVVLACGGTGDDSDNGEAPAGSSPTEVAEAVPTEAESPAEPTDAPAPTELPVEPTPVPEPLTFSGTGATITENFSLAGPLIIVEGTHQGAANFIVSLKEAASAELVDGIVNVIGNYTGTGVFDVQPGDYYFEVDADGPWSLTVKTPAHLPLTEGEGPYTFTGTGSNISPLFMLRDGRVDFDLSHEGEGNFIVTIYNVTAGTFGAGLANEIGPIQNMKLTEQASAGPHLVSVYTGLGTTDTWTVTVSQP